MAAWHSLSGYLYYRPGGTLSRLKSRKRLWYVFDEGHCQLQTYKSEKTAHTKSPMGTLDIRGSAITIAIDQKNQFIILVDEKDHIFTAENHESMMIWMLGLQANRDAHVKKENSIDDPKHTDGISQLNAKTTGGHVVMKRRHTLKDKSTHYWKQYQLQKIGESLETLPTSASPRALEISHMHRHQLSRSLENSMKNAGTASMGFHNHSSSGSAGDSDDVFDEDFLCLTSDSIDYKTHFLRRFNEEHLSQSFPIEIIDSCGRSRSYSGQSGSSDSAIDKGDGAASEASSRMTELERDLIAAKCELAKVMNKHTSYLDLLHQKDDVIQELNQRLKHAGIDGFSQSDVATTDKKKSSREDRESRERTRVLQNQNRFLNEEVRRLAKVRHQEHAKYKHQGLKIQDLECDIDKWKQDYVTVIQSSIHFPSGDAVEEAEVTLYGGNRHKKRIQELLDEARTINPSLPTYEKLANNAVHVDHYGFKHTYGDASLVLHYLCQQLCMHYETQLGTYEQHQLHWKMYLRQQGKTIRHNVKELKVLCRGGIPDQFRRQVWHFLVSISVRDIVEDKGQHYYSNLCSLLSESQVAAHYRKQVSLDIMRTMPSNVKFQSPGSRGIMDLQEVLLAFCIHNPKIGYCQGMNFIVALCLLFLDAHDAFWALVAITERHFSSHYFDHSLIGAQADQQVLKDLLQEQLPNLCHHLTDIDIEISTITLNWFIAIFFDSVPFQTLLRIWDCFLLEGPKVLFRFTLAILKMHEKELLRKPDTISMMKHLKTCAKITYDVDGLMKIAFEELPHFPHRQNIRMKHACYLKVLKEKYKKREIQRRVYAERELMMLEQESGTSHSLVIECAKAYRDGNLWYCYGEQSFAKCCKIVCDEQVMFDLSLEFDARILCMESLSEEVVLLGTLSWILYAYSTSTNTELWHVRLHDVVMCIHCYRENDTIRLFAGLADGTLAVLEDVTSGQPDQDIIYIPIGQSPIVCMTEVDNQLWCASGNIVYIIHASTLDAIDNFTVSATPYDHILSMIPADPGIWISIKGSSILELWDSKLLTCRLLYDTKANKFPNLRKEDDTYFNKARITAILSYENSVWIGTGDGNLIIYELTEKVQTSCVESQTSSVPRDNVMGYNLSLGSFEGVEEKVQELYFQRIQTRKKKSHRRRNLLIDREQVILKDGIPKIVTEQIPKTVTENSKAKRSADSCMDKQKMTPEIKSRPKIISKALEQTNEPINGCSVTTTPDTQTRHKTFKSLGNTEQKSKNSGENECKESGFDVGTVSNKNNNNLRHWGSDQTAFNHDTEIVNQNSSPHLENSCSIGEDVVIINADKQDCMVNDGEIRSIEQSANINPQSGTADANDHVHFPHGNCDSNCNKFLPVGQIPKEIAKPTSVCEYSDSREISDVNFVPKAMLMHPSAANWDSDGWSSERTATPVQIVDDIIQEISNEVEKDISSGNIKSSTPNSNVLNDNPENCHKNSTTQPRDRRNSEQHHISRRLYMNNSSSEEMKPRPKSTSIPDVEHELRYRLEFSNLDVSRISSSPNKDSLQSWCRNLQDQDDPTMSSSGDICAEGTSVEGVDNVGRNTVVSYDNVEKGGQMQNISKTKSDEVDSCDVVTSEVSNFEGLSASPLKSTSFSMLDSNNQTSSSWGMLSGDLADSDCTTGQSDSMVRLSSDSYQDFNTGPDSLELQDLQALKYSQSIASSYDQSWEKKVTEFLRTPSFGTPQSSILWSSYDEISTPSICEYESQENMCKRNLLRLDSMASQTPSTLSFASATDVLSSYDLNLQAKIKISDKPVRCLVLTRCQSGPVILSCSGCYGDDESVLMWMRENQEKMWTNIPVCEICPKTNETKSPSYMKGRMSRTSSLKSQSSGDSISSIRSRFLGDKEARK